MRMTSELHVLELTAELLGEKLTVHPVLIASEEGLTLVDCGYPGQLPLLRQAVEAAGYSLSEVRRIVITHHDIDHIGGLPAVLNAVQESVEVCAHAQERPHIEGELPLAKVTPESLARLDQLPEPHRSALKQVLTHPPSAPVNRIVSHGEELSDGGGLVIIDTPGHTSGHISLYHRPTRTLIAADALVVNNGRLRGPVPEQTLDIALALRSLNPLLHYEIERIVCYHGGVYSAPADSIRKSIAAIASGDDAAE